MRLLAPLTIWTVAGMFLESCSNTSHPTSLRDASESPSKSRHSDQASTNPNGTFARGSSHSEVRAVMGSPDNFLEKPNGSLVWYYRSSAVSFRNGKVTEWLDFSNVLKTRGPGDARIASKKEEEMGEGRALYAPAGIVGAGSLSSSRSSGATNPSIQYVDSYTRADGSSVQGHYRTRSDSSSTNNFSSRGNVNPMTGRRGYR